MSLARLFALVLLVALPAVAADDDFGVNLAEARANLESAEGAAFDRKLGTETWSPEMEARMNVCMETHYRGEAATMEGYFEFPEDGGDYRVVLRPATPFSRCVEGAMEGGDAPEPPSRPWYNHYRLNIAAT